MTTLIRTQEITYPSGATFHVRAEATRLTEYNTDSYVVSYTVNGSAFTANGEPRIRTYFASRAMWWHPQYEDSLQGAIDTTLYAFKCAQDAREFRQDRAGDDTPLRRVSRIMDYCRDRRNPVESAMSFTALTDVPKVRIEVWRDNFETVSDAIECWKAGVAIEWRIKERPAQTEFRGMIAANDVTEKIPVAAIMADTDTGDTGSEKKPYEIMRHDGNKVTRYMTDDEYATWYLNDKDDVA